MWYHIYVVHRVYSVRTSSQHELTPEPIALKDVFMVTVIQCADRILISCCLKANLQLSHDRYL